MASISEQRTNTLRELLADAESGKPADVLRLYIYATSGGKGTPLTPRQALRDAPFAFLSGNPVMRVNDLLTPSEVQRFNNIIEKANTYKPLVTNIREKVKNPDLFWVNEPLQPGEVDEVDEKLPIPKPMTKKAQKLMKQTAKLQETIAKLDERLAVQKSRKRVPDPALADLVEEAEPIYDRAMAELEAEEEHPVPASKKAVRFTKLPLPGRKHLKVPKSKHPKVRVPKRYKKNPKNTSDIATSRQVRRFVYLLGGSGVSKDGISEILTRVNDISSELLTRIGAVVGGTGRRIITPVHVRYACSSILRYLG